MIGYESGIFHMQTAQSSYLIRVHEEGYLEQLYYGYKIRRAQEYCALYEKTASGYGNTNVTPTNGKQSLDAICLEYSYSGTGDYRHLPLQMEMPDSSYSQDFRYVSHEIYEGEYRESETTCMPYARENATAYGAKAQTLDITLKDRLHKVWMHLIYTVFADCDVITRRVKIENRTGKAVIITKVMSMMLDLPDAGYRLHTFDGLWIRERQEHVRELVSGLYVNDSTTGSSSNRHNPYIMLSRTHTTETDGECIGLNLIYSGNHYEAVEVSEHGRMRIMSGINPHQFRWELGEGESFYAPEAVLSYSRNGMGGLSRQLHRFVQHHIVSPDWAYRERPVLINNWEATYFDFNGEKLRSLAAQAKDLGIEMLVLDDGWFGHREDDTSSLGDWFVNEQKLGGTLSGLAKGINDLGLSFGLWFEPEMISEKSRLYEAHPDWAVTVPGRTQYLGRNQMVLDMTRQDVRDYLVHVVGRVLDQASISYVKWDMNRHISDAYSATLGTRQGEFYHRYILGVYDVMARITKAHTDILFEGCSAGGNRFDLAMLFYMPQIWTSDDTDANERTHIQRGTSFAYPLSTMAAHVSAVPNHQTLRNTSIETRFDIAAFGMLGYEIDITLLSHEEKEAIRRQVAFYKEHRILIQTGEFYRIECDENHVIWQVMSQDRREGLVMTYQRLALANQGSDVLKLAGLLEEEQYQIRIRDAYGEEEIHTGYGDLLMYAGVKLNQQFVGAGIHPGTRVLGDFSTRIYEIKTLAKPEKD